jgi:MinD-like ATPase involved in chromosome partitioning or flagellar assembly
MALANIAWLLADRGRRVLCVDFDLEAAGLPPYFQGWSAEPLRLSWGVMDLLDGPEGDWRSMRSPIRRDGAHLDLLPAGEAAPNYIQRLQGLDWERLYAQGLGERLEALREQWTAEYDCVLIDSRTGLSDIGGVCTVQLPDFVAMVLTPNEQSLKGTVETARRVNAARADYGALRAQAPILPIISRFEGRTELDKAQHWLRRFAEELKPLYEGWLDARVSPAQILRHTRIPAVPHWAFEESLPVCVEDLGDPETISYAYATLAALVDHGLEHTSMVIRERESFVKERDLSAFTQQVDGNPAQSHVHRRQG